MSATRSLSIPLSPYRPKHRTSSKLIFISCEGSVTEWEYFQNVVNEVFANVKTRVHIVNVIGDILEKSAKKRSPEENQLVSSSNPQNVFDKMLDFKNTHNEEYDFTNHHDDEFWLIMDVDSHTDENIIDKFGISNSKKWNDILFQCKAHNFNYAVSNPFFELWLLLHHDDVNTNLGDTDNDFQWAVTADNRYRSTDHFLNRLSALGAKLKDKKHIDPRHYDKEKIQQAICRAKALDTEPPCDYPTKLGTTVYRLLETIEIISNQFANN